MAKVITLDLLAEEAAKVIVRETGADEAQAVDWSYDIVRVVAGLLAEDIRNAQRVAPSMGAAMAAGRIERTVGIA